MFFTRSDFEGVASTRAHRPTKQFEATLDRLFGERVRADGAFGVDLWCALAGVEWRNGQGETVCYSHRVAGEVVAWVREDGSYLEWYASGDPGEVVDWVGDALHAYVTSRRQRKKIEMLFAHLKRILKLDRLRLRGPNGTRDEFHLAATA